jgi:hypothetical protein
MIEHNRCKYAEELLAEAVKFLDIIIEFSFGVNFLKTLVIKCKKLETLKSKLLCKYLEIINKYIEKYEIQFAKKENKVKS